VSKKRVFLLKVCAVLVGLGLIGATEGTLRLIGVPPYSQIVSMSLLSDGPVAHRLFALETGVSGQRSYVASEEQSGLQINTQSFPAVKRPGTLRIFCFGGSTTYGFPVGDKVSFGRWMREFLEIGCPDHDFEVVNCGVLGMNSSGIAAAAQECLAYQPDLFVVLCGHNERARLVPKSLSGFFEGSQMAHKARLFLARNLRIYSALAQLYARATRPDVTETMPVTSIMKGPTLHDKESLDRVTRFDFDFSLEVVADLARHANVGLIFAAPCPNCCDCSPVGSFFEPCVGQQEQSALLAELRRARLLLTNNRDPQAALNMLRALVAKQPNYALFRFWQAKCYEKTGRLDQAREEYLVALDKEWCGTRMTPTLLVAMREVAERSAVPFVDLFSVFASHSPGGLVGSNLIIDNCHPTVGGYRIIAKAVLQESLSQGLLPSDCRIDRFDQIMAQFPEEDLITEADRAKMAEWMGEYYLGRRELKSAVAWLEKALQMNSRKRLILERLDLAQELMRQQATESSIVPGATKM